MFHDFPQIRTEKNLIQLKLKATIRRRTANHIPFLNAALHHFTLKGSTYTTKCYWCAANPSKPSFHDWRNPSEGIICFALTQATAEALQLQNKPGGARSWFFSPAPGPSALALRTSSSTMLCQHDFILGSVFMGSLPYCWTSLALTSSLLVLQNTSPCNYYEFNSLHNSIALCIPVYKEQLCLQQYRWTLPYR